GGNAGDSGEEGGVAEGVSDREELAPSGAVELDPNETRGAHRTKLAREQQRPPGTEHVEGLDAECIGDGDETVVEGVPEHGGEHPIEALQHGRGVLVVRCHYSIQDGSERSPRRERDSRNQKSISSMLALSPSADAG